MNNSNDFTYDKGNFRDLPEFVKDLHARGMHYIPLVDAGVSASEIPGTYPPFDIGIKMDIFVKNSTGQPFIGKVCLFHLLIIRHYGIPKEYMDQMSFISHVGVEQSFYSLARFHPSENS